MTDSLPQGAIPAPIISQLKIDQEGVVLAGAVSNVLMDGFTQVAPEIEIIARGYRSGRCRLISGAIEPRDVPDPIIVPEEISDRQFFQQLAVDAEITEEEAEDAVASGTVPAALLAVVNQLPADQRFAARMFLKGATVFKRSHPMTAVIAAAKGWSSSRVDALWTNASAL